MGLGADSSTRFQWKACDLQDLNSVRSVAQELLAQPDLRLDAIVCNAAVYGPHSPTELHGGSLAAESGNEARYELEPELTMRVNHLSHALLSLLLREKLQESSGRLVFVVSSLYKRR